MQLEDPVVVVVIITKVGVQVQLIKVLQVVQVLQEATIPVVVVVVQVKQVIQMVPDTVVMDYLT